MNIFTHFGSFCETSGRFDLSSRSLGHVIFSRETAQEAHYNGFFVIISCIHMKFMRLLCLERAKSLKAAVKHL